METCPETYLLSPGNGILGNTWVRFGHGHVIVKVGDIPVGSIFSRTGSGEVEGGISGEPECDAWRSALFWKETSAGRGTEGIGVEVAWMVGGIVRAGELSRAATAAAGSGEVAESWKSPVAV